MISKKYMLSENILYPMVESSVSNSVHKVCKDIWRSSGLWRLSIFYLYDKSPTLSWRLLEPAWLFFCALWAMWLWPIQITAWKVETLNFFNRQLWVPGELAWQMRSAEIAYSVASAKKMEFFRQLQGSFRVVRRAQKESFKFIDL